MIFKSPKDTDIKNNASDAVFPMMPLRDIVVFPFMVVPLFVGRKKSISALEEALRRDKNIFLSAQRDANVDNPDENDIYSLGTLCTIIQLLRLPDGSPGVQVSVQGQPSISVLPDAKGHFQLDLPGAGTYNLSAVLPGMGNPVSIEVKLEQGAASPAPVFYLRAPETLGEMVVTAQRAPERVSKSVISGKALRQLAGSSGDPLRGLQSLPGVATVNGSSAPAVRGSGPGDNAYYVDDLYIGKLFHYGAISVFNADLIEGFDLYAAAFSPHYGNVTGAVIDVALREPRKDRLGGKVNVNLMGADFLVEGPQGENQSFYFAARRSYIDLLIKEIEQDGVTVQIPNYWDYQGKYLWQVNREKVLILIDDVTTTGATIRECAKVLMDAGAKEVRAITLAQA